MIDVKQRFLNRVIKTDSCWNWQGSKGFWKFGKSTIAYRASYEIFVGPIPPGMSILHSCDNPVICVRPEHLRPGTHLENMRDMVTRGRKAVWSGEEAPRAKLTWEKVHEIRNLAETISRTKLAKLYDVSGSAIHAIISGRTWRGNSKAPSDIYFDVWEMGYNLA